MLVLNVIFLLAGMVLVIPVALALLVPLLAPVALAGAASAQVKIALDSPPSMEASGSYVWAHTFSTYLNDRGMKAEEFQRGALGGDDELFDQVSQGLLEVSLSPLNIVGSLDPLIYRLRARLSAGPRCRMRCKPGWLMVI